MGGLENRMGRLKNRMSRLENEIDRLQNRMGRLEITLLLMKPLRAIWYYNSYLVSGELFDIRRAIGC